MSSSKILLGFIAGTAVGAALGILFAPDRGTETRRLIAEKGNDLKDSVKEKVSGIVDDVKEKFAGIKGEADEAAEKGYSAYNRAKSEVNAF